MRERIGGYELDCSIAGRGQSIVALHGGMGLDAEYLRTSLAPLTDSMQVVTYDQLGNGASERPAEWKFGLEKWADDAVAIADRFQLERPILLGHSYGGYIAQTAMLRHPERFSALILVSTAPVLDYAAELVTSAEARGTPEEV